jgi:hypothetical protein
LCNWIGEHVQWVKGNATKRIALKLNDADKQKLKSDLTLEVAMLTSLRLKIQNSALYESFLLCHMATDKAKTRCLFADKFKS